MQKHDVEKGIGTRLAAGKEAVDQWCRRIWAQMCTKARDERGQGTTEYAILVGVIVVLAIVAITLFRPKLQELWDAIVSGINGL